MPVGIAEQRPTDRRFGHAEMGSMLLRFVRVDPLRINFKFLLGLSIRDAGLRRAPYPPSCAVLDRKTTIRQDFYQFPVFMSIITIPAGIAEAGEDAPSHDQSLQYQSVPSQQPRRILSMT